MSDYIHSNVHHFKTHFSKFVRILERGGAKAIIVERYGKSVGLFIPYKTKKDS